MDTPLKAIVTAGPTFEPIDPVRFIGNRSSGKQGYAIASAMAAVGIDVTLISGPTSLGNPPDTNTIRIETAKEMLDTAQGALPADIVVCAAAVSDWAPVNTAGHKIKKRDDNSPPTITLKENPDILKTLANHKNRPKLVIGFAAETENLIENATAKRDRKNCDWLLANLVAQKDKKIFGEDQNHVYLISEQETQDWGESSKTEIAEKLTEKIIMEFANAEQ